MGDPKWSPHPVQFMGFIIDWLRVLVERIAKENQIKLRIGGILITFFLIFISGSFGWVIERVFLTFETEKRFLSILILLISLSSALAAKSLYLSVIEIINLLNSQNNNENISKARKKLSFIVGRDVQNLDKGEILRAAAETAAENAVDGIFAPLFWMFIGIISWQFNESLPGPLALVWIFKASSTIDSMLGYKEGNLRWLGFAGAKLDDILTFIPTRLVLITLPFCCRTNESTINTIKQAWKDGCTDSSPNSGISEAIFAHCANVKMGGENFYKGKKVLKPLIAISAPKASQESIRRILSLSLRLEFTWLLFMAMMIIFLQLLI